MDTYQFIAALVGSLAWPVAAVGMTIFLRKPIIELLQRTKSAEGFGAKLTFAERIEAARVVLERVQEEQPVHVVEGGNEQPALPPPTPDALRELTDTLATSSATGSIIAAWAELERSLRTIAEFNDLSWDDKNFTRNIQNFRVLGYIPERLFEAVQSLRKIRNEVAHAVGSPPTLEEAASFRSTVWEIVDTVGLNAGLHRWR